MRPVVNLPLMLFGALGLFVVLVLLFIFVQVGLVTIAFAKLGLTTGQAFLILFATLFGSGVNLPVHKMKQLVKRPVLTGRSPFGPYQMKTETELVQQVVAVNAGGCIIPVFLSLYFIQQIGLSTGLLVAIGVVTAFCYGIARPVPGKGIGIPVLVPPLVTAIAALLLAPEGHSPHVAYIAGSLGTLIGADVLHLATPRTRQQLDAQVLSIGGAGTFDGIFITGIVAVLLA